jgi:ABC-type Mn2+/Zn2+ transport system permease subunit
VGVLVSLCASLLGTSLVLKRYSMIGDGLSHVGFAALAAAYPLGVSPLFISIPVCIAAAFFLLQRKEGSRIRGDAATALMCSGALAVGVMVISLTTGMNTDVCNYMFGSILAMSRGDLYCSVFLSAAVLALYLLFFNRIFAVTFDETFAEATGTDVRRYNMVIAILTAVTVVLGMRMMGTLLISSLIVFPSLTAMRVTRKFKTTVILSALLAVLCFLTGLVFSYLHAVPTGACIVVINILLFILFFAAGKMRERTRCL